MRYSRRHNKSKKPFGYPKDISEIRLGFQKELFSDVKTCRAIMFVCLKYEKFRISQVNVSDFTFRISTEIFGFVLTIRLIRQPLAIDFQSRYYIYIKVVFDHYCFYNL